MQRVLTRSPSSYKFQSSRCLKGVNRDRLACTYTSQKSVWMNTFIMKSWFTEQFVPQVLKRLNFLKLPLHALLLLNNALSHPSPEDLTYNTKDGQITVSLPSAQHHFCSTAHGPRPHRSHQPSLQKSRSMVPPVLLK